MAQSSIVDTTIVEDLILDLLLNGANKLPGAIRVVAPGEPAPWLDPDRDTDSPPARWVMLHDVLPTGGDTARRDNHRDGATEPCVLRISVCVSDDTARATPKRLMLDAGLVRAALSGAGHEHPSTTHRIEIGPLAAASNPHGPHERQRTAVITGTVIARRRTGTSMSADSGL